MITGLEVRLLSRTLREDSPQIFADLVAQTNADGEAYFSDLPPGRYCVAYMGSGRATSKLTVNVDLSSDQRARVTFGISEPMNP